MTSMSLFTYGGRTAVQQDRDKTNRTLSREKARGVDSPLKLVTAPSHRRMLSLSPRRATAAFGAAIAGGSSGRTQMDTKSDSLRRERRIGAKDISQIGHEPGPPWFSRPHPGSQNRNTAKGEHPLNQVNQGISIFGNTETDRLTWSKVFSRIEENAFTLVHLVQGGSRRRSKEVFCTKVPWFTLVHPRQFEVLT